MVNPWLSVIIPAYNKPDYTRKTLQSIVEQDYRPIEIVISDDCSPISLESLIEEFRQHENDQFRIKFFRQKTNLGPMDNVIFTFDNTTGKYLALIPHDDWYTDKYFFSEAVTLMENNPECYLCGANSVYEGNDNVKMITLPDWLEPQEKWHMLPGDKYIKLLGCGGKDSIGYQAGSGIISNLELLKKLGAFHYPYNITRSLALSMDILPDEGFAFEFLLASEGSAAITEKVVSVRGRPQDSYSQTQAWGHVVGQAMFIIYYNLYKADLHGKYARAVKRRAREVIFHWPVEKMNLKILKHYNYEYNAIWLMLCSYMVRFTILPRRHFSFLKKLLIAIRKRELSYIIAKQKTKGVSGVIRALFRI